MDIKEYKKLEDGFRKANALITEIEDRKEDIQEIQKVIAEIKSNIERDYSFYEASFREFQLSVFNGGKYTITPEDAILVFERRIERRLSLIEVLQAKFEAL